MIKTGDLVGWANLKSKPTPQELDDFGVVVSIFNVEQGSGFPVLKRLRIAWRREPDSPIDEYAFNWAKNEMKVGALVILSSAGDI
jgi:hypothetical protein